MYLLDDDNILQELHRRHLSKMHGVRRLFTNKGKHVVLKVDLMPCQGPFMWC